MLIPYYDENGKLKVMYYSFKSLIWAFFHQKSIENSFPLAECRDYII